MFRTYKYILKLQHVEDGEYSIIQLFSPTSTSLNNLKSMGKEYNYVLKFYLNAY